MGEFKSCPVCQEQSDQCLSCASYVVYGERIYYEKLKDFGAVQDHEVRFINRIKKHSVIAFFHNGKLHIPSRQGRSVPLAIGLQWDAWQEQQSKIEQLEKQQRINAECIKNLVEQKADYLHRVTMASAHLDSFDHSRAGINQLIRSIESALEALRGECE